MKLRTIIKALTLTIVSFAVMSCTTPRVRKDSNNAGTNTDSENIALTDASVTDAGLPGEAATGTSLMGTNLEAMPIQKFGPQIEGIKLDTRCGEPAVIITASQLPSTIEFARTAPSEYSISIPSTELSSTISTSPMVLPTRSGAIRSVRVSKNGSAAYVKVFANPDSELQASKETPNELVLANCPGTSLQGVPVTLAQANPEALSPTAAPQQDVAAPAAPNGLQKEGMKPDLGTASDVKPAESSEDLSALLGDDKKYTGKQISLDLQDTDIDNALRIIAEVSNLNIIASSDVAGKVTLRLIDVPWDQALDVILKTNALDKVQEGNVVRIAPVEKLRQEREALKQAQLAEDELEPLAVKYIRISYARAGELKALIETVLTERGSVAIDERSNQLIIKDIKRGIKNAVDLITKLDLRTPQVLLETQIVETTTSFSRDLGAELGFSRIQSPETGNGTGFNFPNSVEVNGSLPNGNLSSFPAAVGATSGSAMDFIFGSADGTMNLSTRISALESEGRVRVVSRPSVATTNNKPAEITSNRTILVRMPSGGASTVVGQQSSSASQSATQQIKAGITLKVTPQASPDYYVLMDIDATSSSFQFGESADGLPTIIERKATSTVLVSSGQTFAIGGIYKLTDSDTFSGVPFLKDLPILGNLFSRSFVSNNDEELLFFITPRIVEGSFDDAAMSGTPS